MKRTILSVAALALLAACQDNTSPITPDGLGPADVSPSPATVGAAAPSADAIPTAETARQLWAVVRDDGRLSHGSRVTGTSHLGTGRYEVTFNRDVRGCAYIATTINAHTQALGIFTASGHLSANGVYVETKNQGGGLTDGPFDLLVACGPLSTRFAVIGYSANLVRATSGTTLTPLGAGRYNVRFTNAVRGCAYLATVGDPGNALVFNPSGVYTGSGPDANTVYIETKNPGGGLQDGVPFHLALICPGTSSARFTVTKAGGPAKRASAGTSSSRPATGTYSVVNAPNIAACAVLATRGSVDTAVPFSPATVEILPGQSSTTFGVQVRQLLFFGGALSNQAFHAAAIC
jgi:hypothetical protein